MVAVVLPACVYLLIFGGGAVALAPRLGWVAKCESGEQVAFAVVRAWFALEAQVS